MLTTTTCHSLRSHALLIQDRSILRIAIDVRRRGYIAEGQLLFCAQCSNGWSQWAGIAEAAKLRPPYIPPCNINTRPCDDPVAARPGFASLVTTNQRVRKPTGKNTHTNPNDSESLGWIILCSKKKINSKLFLRSMILRLKKETYWTKKLKVERKTQNKNCYCCHLKD